MLEGKYITPTVRRKALSYLMLLKRKRSGQIKGRGVADGRLQREYILMEEYSSPTISLYALVASCVMDAIEGRSVITCDLPAAFLQGNYHQEEGKECYLKFKGVMVEMICKINLAFQRKVVETHCGQRLLYGQLEKTVYGTLLGTIILYQKLSNQLTKWGFEMNPYNKCTFNKTVNGE